MLGKIAQQLLRTANPRLTLNNAGQHVFEVTDFENTDGKNSFGVELIFSEDDRMPLLKVEFEEDGDSNGKLAGIGVTDIFKTDKVLLDLCACALERCKPEELFSPVAPEVTIEKGCEPCCKILCTGWTPPPQVQQAPIGQVNHLGQA